MYHTDNVNDNKIGYLILDQATSHITTNVLNLLKSGNKDVSIIPGGLTRFFQPLDVAINQPFKVHLRELYISYCIKNGEDNKNISRTKMIEFVCNAWYDLLNYIINQTQYY